MRRDFIMKQRETGIGGMMDTLKNQNKGQGQFKPSMGGLGGEFK
jgi:hypothetical protein